MENLKIKVRKSGENKDCMMIGDGLIVDILGAQEAGWDAVYFNPSKVPHTEKPTYEISSLDGLVDIL